MFFAGDLFLYFEICLTLVCILIPFFKACPLFIYTHIKLKQKMYRAQLTRLVEEVVYILQEEIEQNSAPSDTRYLKKIEKKSGVQKGLENLNKAVKNITSPKEKRTAILGVVKDLITAPDGGLDPDVDVKQLKNDIIKMLNVTSRGRG